MSSIVIHSTTDATHFVIQTSTIPNPLDSLRYLPDMSARAVLFAPGQVIVHRLFEYRGVVTDVDATFQLSAEWYEEVARTRPPKDEPWYHVLVDGSDHSTYVAERNLRADPSPVPIEHPALDEHFDAFEDGRYLRRAALN